MQAITLKANGGIENLVYKEIDRPIPQPGEVLIKTAAISINPVDVFLRENNPFMIRILSPKPGEEAILGWDVAGTVEETGEGVKDLKKGDAVFGMVNFPGHGRAYAEYVVAPAHQLAVKPSNVSYPEAAAATLAALTAWQALVTYGQVKKNEKVLIHAAAGGVGIYAVQLAKWLGAYVIGTGSAANKEFLMSLGIDEFIDYTQEKFEDRVKDADLVLDSISGDNLRRSLDAVKPGGRVISLVTFFEGATADKAREKGVMTHRLGVASSGEDMRHIAALLGKGVLRSYISEKFSFHEMGLAHEKVATGRTRGKIVVTI